MDQGVNAVILIGSQWRVSDPRGESVIHDRVTRAGLWPAWPGLGCATQIPGLQDRHSQPLEMEEPVGSSHGEPGITLPVWQ